MLALAKADHILITTDQPASELLPEILLCVDLIEQLVGILHNSTQLFDLSSDDEKQLNEIADIFQEIGQCLFSLHQRRANEATTCFQIPTSLTHCSTAGRPKYDNPKSVLEELRGLGFSWSKVASMFSVSRWTVYRRIEEY